MGTNKRLIIIFSSLVAAVVLVVVLCVIFITGNVYVKTATDTVLDKATMEEIVLKSGIAKYSSIFSVSEQKAIDNIEGNFPSLKVISIERKFPNNVEIKITSRLGIIAIKINDGGYAILDRELKVVQVLSVPEGGQIQLDSYTVVDGLELVSPVVEGSFMNDNLWLKDLATAAKDLSFINKRFPAFIKKISLNNSVITNNLDIQTVDGVRFILDSSDAGKMFNLAYSYFLTLRSSQPDKLEYGHIIMNTNDEGETAWVWRESF